MATTKVDNTELDRFNQLIQTDPKYVALIQQLRSAPGGQPTTDAVLAIQSYLQSKGVDTKGMGLQVEMDGRLTRNHDTRNTLLAAGALLGGGYALSLLPAFGAGAAGAGATTAGSAAPATAGTTAATGAGVGNSIWSQLGGWKGALDIGGKIGGDLLNYRAASNATKAQKDATEKALAVQQQMYGDFRTANRPYEESGYSALSELMGKPIQAPPAYAGPTSNNPTGTLASLAAPAQTRQPAATVQLRAPNGQVQAVPADQADHYLQRGAQRVA